MVLAIDIAVEHNGWRSVGDIDALARRALEATMDETAAAVSDGTAFSLVLCGDAFIQALNQRWRGKDTPTNVLSFPADSSAHLVTLGDIVVAYETSAREAADAGKDLGDHLSHLVVHGALHLLGYDHETDAEADAMERIEVRALTRLGIASPYEEAALMRAPP